MAYFIIFCLYVIKLTFTETMNILLNFIYYIDIKIEYFNDMTIWHILTSFFGGNIKILHHNIEVVVEFFLKLKTYNILQNYDFNKIDYLLNFKVFKR